MVKLYLIRHAESVSNKMKKDVFQSFGLDTKDTKLCLAYKFIKSEEVVDSLLSEMGKKQCEQARQKNLAKLKPVKHVLCSPLRRCLDTARRVLDTESIKSEGGKMVVRGELREILCCQGDFPMMVEDSVNNFREFDFSPIEEDLAKFKEFFFVNYLENERSVEEIKDYASGLEGSVSRDTKTDYLIDLLKRRLLENNLIETNYDTYKRVVKFKQMVKTYIQENDVKDGELAIVAHLRIIKAWTSTHFDVENDKYMGNIDPENCALIEVDVN